MASNGKIFVSSVAQALLLLLWILLHCFYVLSRFIANQLEATVISVGRRIGGQVNCVNEETVRDGNRFRPVKSEDGPQELATGTADSKGASSSHPWRHACDGKAEREPRATKNQEVLSPNNATASGVPQSNVSPAAGPSTSVMLSMYRMRQKFYAISMGFHDGIFTFWWGGGHPQINKAKPSVHRGFSLLDHAELWLRTECNFRGHIHHWEVVRRNENGHSIFRCILCGEMFVRDRRCCDNCDRV